MPSVCLMNLNHVTPPSAWAKISNPQETQKIFLFLHYQVILFKARFFNADICIDRFRLLVVPPKLQAPLFGKTRRTRSSGRLKGFMDLPMDVVYEVSLRTISSKCGRPNIANNLPDCHVSCSKGSPAIIPALEAI